jgi:thioredoxin 1
MVEKITDANFEEKVIKAGVPALIDFSATWCGPCRMVSPIVHEMAAEYSGRLAVGEVDVDENPGVTAQFRVRNIPTVLLIKNGEVVDKIVGAVPKSNFKAMVEKHL